MFHPGLFEFLDCCWDQYCSTKETNQEDTSTTNASADADANISLEDRNSSASGGEGTTVLSQGQNNVASRVAGDKKGSCSSLTAETVEDAGLGDR